MSERLPPVCTAEEMHPQIECEDSKEGIVDTNNSVPNSVATIDSVAAVDSVATIPKDP